MSHNIDITEILEVVSSEADEKTVKAIAIKLVEKYPEKAAKILDNLKLKSSFDAGYFDITTAKELSSKDKIAIEQKLSDGSSSFKYSVDPAILGGIIIKNGEKITDNSVKSRIDNVFNKINS